MVELGRKYECPDCEVKFYDLGRPEALCPKCGLDQKDDEEEPASRPAPNRTAPVRTATSTPSSASDKDDKDDDKDDEDEVAEVIATDDDEDDDLDDLVVDDDEDEDEDDDLDD